MNATFDIVDGFLHGNNSECMGFQSAVLHITSNVELLYIKISSRHLNSLDINVVINKTTSNMTNKMPISVRSRPV